jgi:hypothetical protein
MSLMGASSSLVDSPMSDMLRALALVRTGDGPSLPARRR